MLDRFAGRHVLLLQGPQGPFFKRLAAELAASGARVSKVNFNGGDDWYFPREAAESTGGDLMRFRGTAAQWAPCFSNFLVKKKVDAVMLFGDCRPFHRAGVAACRVAGIDFWVFEEGYLRPHFITMEKGGVNGNSQMCRDPAFYENQKETTVPTVSPVGRTFGLAAQYAAGYALASAALWWRYPHYHHHRDISIVRQPLYWLRGLLRKKWHQRLEATKQGLFAGALSGQFFLVPLQVHLDAQLGHSDFSSIEAFIEHVVGSFCSHADRSLHLVLKQHPFDRPYKSYVSLVRRLARSSGVSDRLHLVHDLHLPTLLDHARGVVVMNSTVGMSALQRRTPTKALGQAVYDIKGLTHQGALADFWQAPGVVDAHLLRKYEAWLRRTVVFNGSFQRVLDGPGATGIVWSSAGEKPEKRRDLEGRDAG